jgi:hypothetical protein
MSDVAYDGSFEGLFSSRARQRDEWLVDVRFNERSPRIIRRTLIFQVRASVAA